MRLPHSKHLCCCYVHESQFLPFYLNYYKIWRLLTYSPSLSYGWVEWEPLVIWGSVNVFAATPPPMKELLAPSVPVRPAGLYNVPPAFYEGAPWPEVPKSYLIFWKGAPPIIPWSSFLGTKPSTCCVAKLTPRISLRALSEFTKSCCPFLDLLLYKWKDCDKLWTFKDLCILPFHILSLYEFKL